MEAMRIAKILSEHRECYASCNRSHPHCANYIHGSQDVWPCEKFELAMLAAQSERYREALASIAANTCCEDCGEAALVAAAALEKEAEGDWTQARAS